MANDQTWQNPGTRAAPAVVLPVARRAAAGLSGGNAAFGWTASIAPAHNALINVHSEASFGPAHSGTAAWIYGDRHIMDGVVDSYPLALADGAAYIPASSQMLETLAGTVSLSRSISRHSRLGSSFEAKHVFATGVNEMGRLKGRFGGSAYSKTTGKRVFSWMSRYSYNCMFVKGGEYAATNSVAFTAGADMFSLGEDITITYGINSGKSGQTSQGKFIHDTGTHLAIYCADTAITNSQDGPSASYFNEAVITGNSSGASRTYIADTSGFISISPKEFRIAQSGSNDPTALDQYVYARGSIHNRSFISIYWDAETQAKVNDPTAGTRNIPVGAQSEINGGWTRWMIIFDEATANLTLRIGNQAAIVIPWDASSNHPTQGMQLNVIGLDMGGGRVHHSRLNWSEIYADDTLTWFALSDSATAAGVDRNSMELCRIDSLASASTGVIEVNRGGFADGTQLYLYQADNYTGDFVNSAGVAV